MKITASTDRRVGHREKNRKIAEKKGLHLKNGHRESGERLAEAEIRSILEGIARDSGNSAAKIAALKQLRRMRAAV